MNRLAPLLLVTMIAGLAEAQLIIAHRGASHLAPENTLAAFNLAWELGADGIEGDFHLTTDGQIVCLHDKDTQRTGGRKLIAKDATLAELRELEYGAWKGDQWRGEPLPTFAQVAATVPGGKRFFVELKCGPEIVEPLRKALAESDLGVDQVTLISFSQEVIAECDRLLPHYATQWLTSYRREADAWTPSADDVIQTLHACRASGLGCKAERKCFDAAFVKRLRDAGFASFGVWTVDDPATARFYQQLGAAAITTNRPGWLREQLNE